MPNRPHVPIPRSLIPTLLALALAAVPTEAQVLDQSLVPKGRFRVQMHPSFSAWDQRFGMGPGGESRVESLGDDLTDPTGVSLFPAIADLETQLRELIGDPAYAGLLGPTEGYVNQDVTRIDFGGHLGVFDWLTVGAVVPWVRTRTAVELAFQADAAANLGLNPTVSNTDAVLAFLDALSTAGGAAQTRADGLCTSGPSSPTCTGAQGLADRVEALRRASEGAYFASGFFPLEGSDAAQALLGLTDALNTDLGGAGLAPLFAPAVFATAPPTADDLVGLPAVGASGIQGLPLRTYDPLWGVGDIELSALARVLSGGSEPGPDGASPLRYEILAGAVVRLGTGSLDENDVFLDVGTGDAQMDYEGRVSGALYFGSSAALRGAVQYGSQRPVSLLRRVASPDVAMPPGSALRAVRWSPAPYLGFEVEPGVRLSDELSLTGHYRLYSKGTDGYEQIGPDPEGAGPVDISSLETESGVTQHVAGLGLRYSTVVTWQEGRTTRPLQVHARLIRAVAGSGGHTPKSTRFELGIAFFQGIWGGP